jgi:hypothetical protein
MDTEPRQSANGIQRGLQVDRHRGVRRTRLDHRTRAGRRAKELREHYTAALGERELTVELLAAISRAAELQAISEQLRADAVRGLPVSPDDLVRIERLTSSALRALCLPRAASKPTPTLAEYLAAKHAEGAE